VDCRRRTLPEPHLPLLIGRDRAIGQHEPASRSLPDHRLDNVAEKSTGLKRVVDLTCTFEIVPGDLNRLFQKDRKHKRHFATASQRLEKPFRSLHVPQPQNFRRMIRTGPRGRQGASTNGKARHMPGFAFRLLSAVLVLALLLKFGVRHLACFFSGRPVRHTGGRGGRPAFHNVPAPLHNIRRHCPAALPVPISESCPGNI
jgi:hypothetical protein